MKRLSAALLLVLASISCSAGAASVAEVKKKGTLVLGTDPTFAPFEFKGSDGQVQGFDIDIARAVAHDLGVRLEIRPVGFGALMPQAVTSGRVDVAMSGITITPERATVVTFSQPYYRSAQVFIVRSGNPGKFTWPADVKGKTVGVQANTTGQYAAEQTLKPRGATIKVYDDFAAGLADVRSGRIAALIGDAPTVNDLKKRLPGQFDKAGAVLVAEDYGMVFRKGSDLAAAANRTLARLKRSGEYQKLLNKWIVQK
ncbi:ABC transporter substrate-binding protein [Deinococcus radiodurans]|jgi:amino acid ABC transporter substrate-binding protein, PAAT family (TC 3.A.1.3.-)|nr:ABC transporter substrate-binding protein [Deinococcus radiodurans]ANC70666.1 amino acid ABC transporter substrate-binding protein [Deinococcus radiodurans R1 = ATCC 13939 = DSM 20539]QIP27955.1 amino acid ABC transporter substrate-binding protein [Deinococcus radiodurans]QIP31164.1 amino acid ABC transporter substrate-binding protein [Deinococcus radiodurans]UID71240.1 amino acid ABC transporter substrate-binding protein [Deinococcus radiodurans R1 = ATCC 13939 = DSM 20539]